LNDALFCRGEQQPANCAVLVGRKGELAQLRRKLAARRKSSLRHRVKEASDEEYQFSERRDTFANEELQSTNESWKPRKRSLSANEELNTVNDELTTETWNFERPTAT